MKSNRKQKQEETKTKLRRVKLRFNEYFNMIKLL